MSSEDWNNQTCVFCLKHVKDPMLLVCGHNVCAACLDEALLFSEAIASFSSERKTDAEKKESGSCVACPLCGGKTKQSQVKPNIVLRAVVSSEAQLAEAADSKPVCGFCKEPATKVCAFCGTLCDKHSQFLHVDGPMRTHEVTEIQPGKKPQLEWSAPSDSSFQHLPMCSEHKKRCELVCQSCNMLVCTHCVFIGRHKTHSCVAVHELFKKMTPEILKLADSIREAVPSCDKLLQGFEILEKNSEQSHKELEEEVNKTFAEYQEALEKKRQEVLKDMNRMYEDFCQTVGERKKALKTLHTKCDDYVSRVAKEESIPKNAVARYALFHMLNELNDVLKVVVDTRPPDEKTKICRVVYKKEYEDPHFAPATAIRMFRLGGGKKLVYDINMANLPGSHSSDSDINAVEETSHDGSAFYDPGRNTIFAVSGNGNNCRDVLVTRLIDGTHGETTRRANLIPFSSHGQYPVFDGNNYAYFFESEGDDDDTRFGRLNLDTMTFEDLGHSESCVREFNSGCCAGGMIFVVFNEGDRLMQYNPDSNTWTDTGVVIDHDCRLLSDPLDSDIFYILYAGTRGLHRFNIADHSISLVAGCPRDFDLNQNGEALVVALTDMSRVLFTSLSNHWYFMTFDNQRWTELEHWENAHNGSAHLVIVPTGPTALYHIDDEQNWTGVNLG